MRKSITLLILAAFLTNTFVPYTHAQQAVNLPNAGMRLDLSQAFAAPLLKGVKVHVNDPFRLDFILDRGDSTVSKHDANRLIKYFLAALTVPEEDLWVNLSPYEKDRIVPEAFGQTEMGRDLLAQDYILKQVTASLMYPEGDVGREFWAKIYARAQEQFGTTDIPVDTFNKVWIVPEKATVYENKNAAFVVESRLKVMLESDYLAASTSDAPEVFLAKDVLRSVIIPVLEKEVNEGRNFAPLRQVYHSLILATWFKDKIKQTVLGPLYVDRKKVSGIDIADKAEKEKIWAQYVEAFRKGVFDFVKEERDAASDETIPRKYFSGGAGLQIKAKDVYRTTGEVSRLPKDFTMDRAEIIEMKGEAMYVDEERAAASLSRISLDRIGARVVYDALGEEDVVGFSKFKYGSVEMVRRFGEDLLKKIRLEFGEEIRRDPGNWAVISAQGGAKFLSEYVARGLGLHFAYVRIDSPNPLRIANYAAANDMEARLNIINSKILVLQTSKKLKAKKVILIDDLLNRGVTLGKCRDFLEAKHGLDVEGVYVLFSISQAEDAALESRLNTAFVDAQGIENLIKMVNGEDVFVTRHLLRQLLYKKDRIRNMLALAPDKRRQVLAAGFASVFAATLTLVRMKADLLYRKLKERSEVFTFKTVVKDRATLAEISEKALEGHLGSLSDDIENAIMPQEKDGAADKAQDNAAPGTEAARAVFSNIDGFGASRISVEHAFDQKEIDELVGMGFTPDALQRELSDDFRTNKFSIAIMEEQYRAYKEDIKAMIAARKEGLREIRVGLAGVGKAALEFTTVVRLFREAFEESGIAIGDAWKVNMVLIDSDRDMLVAAHTAMERGMGLLERLPFGLTIHRVHEDFFDTRAMTRLAAKEEYRGMDYMFNRNTVYGHDAAKFAIREDVLKNYAKNYGDPGWRLRRSMHETRLFEFLGVYLATKNILSVFCRKGTRYITEPSSNHAVLMIPGTRVLTEDRGTGFYEVEDPDEMSREGVASFVKYVESRAQAAASPADNAMRTFTDEERGQIRHTFSYLQQVARAVKDEIGRQGVDGSFQLLERWLEENIHKTDEELYQQPERIAEVLQVIGLMIDKLQLVAGVVSRYEQENGRGLVTFNGQGQLLVDSHGIGESLLYDVKDKLGKIIQIFMLVFDQMSEDTAGDDHDIMFWLKDLRGQLTYSYPGYLEMIEDILHPELIQGAKLDMKMDYSRESNGLPERIYAGFLLPALPVIVPGGEDKAQAAPGGIDLNSKNMPINVRSSGEGVSFNFDPALVQRFQNAVGLTPVILDIHPMTMSLPTFLGISDNVPAQEMVLR